MKLPLYWPPGFEENTVGFDYEEFRKDIAANGHAFWWQYGVPCPCRDKYEVGRAGRVLYPHSAITNCPNCKGGSIFYVEGQASIGVVSGYGEKGVVSQYMLRMQPGEIFVSLPPEHRVDMDDRFTDLSISRPVSEIIKRESVILTPRYPVTKQPMKLGDPVCPGTSIATDVGVTYMCKSDVNGNYVAGWVGLEDVHYVLTEDGRFDFSLSDADIALNGPVDGEHISVRYNCHPTYKVKEIVRQGRDKAIVIDPDTGCELSEIGLGPVFVILYPEYRGFRDPPNAAYNVETDE